jgi:hypothetical protein
MKAERGRAKRACSEPRALASGLLAAP